MILPDISAPTIEEINQIASMKFVRQTVFPIQIQSSFLDYTIGLYNPISKTMINQVLILEAHPSYTLNYTTISLRLLNPIIRQSLYFVPKNE